MYQTTRRPLLPITLMGIPDGVAGTVTTLNVMRKLARTGRLTPLVRATVLEAVGGLDQKDFSGEVRALHQYVRDRIRYVRDPIGAELVQTPEATIRLGAGDCDDKSTLLASMLASIGVPPRFVAVGMRPGSYSHVYVEARLGTRWIPLETTEMWDAGRAPSNAVMKMYRNV